MKGILAIFILVTVYPLTDQIATANRGQNSTSPSLESSIIKISINAERDLSDAKQWLQNQSDSFRIWYSANRAQVVSDTEWAKSLRQSEAYSVALLLLAGSVLLWGRDNIQQLKELFLHLVQRDPVPFNKKIGVKQDYLSIVRQVIFYSCLYILYELVSRLLAFRNDSDVAFYANLVFRATLIFLLLRAYRSLKNGILNQETLSDDKKQTLQQWFNEHFARLNVSATRVRRLAISIFILTIGPSVLLHVPQLLDFVVSL
jgi:hypothetical protein